MEVSVGLVHWPVRNRQGDVVATSVTNLDIHDIARVCRSYAVESYFVINRLTAQQIFVERVLDHWRVGFGQKFNPMRKTALGIVRTASTIEDVVKILGGAFVVSTAARSFEELSKEVASENEIGEQGEERNKGGYESRPQDRKEIFVKTQKADLSQLKSFSFSDLREKIQQGSSSQKLLLLFGTGFGLHSSVLASSQGLLEPIWGGAPDKYRHLSVRSAVSICLDRLLAAW